MAQVGATRNEPCLLSTGEGEVHSPQNHVGNTKDPERTTWCRLTDLLDNSGSKLTHPHIVDGTTTALGRGETWGPRRDFCGRVRSFNSSLQHQSDMSRETKCLSRTHLGDEEPPNTENMEFLAFNTGRSAMMPIKNRPPTPRPPTPGETPSSAIRHAL